MSFFSFSPGWKLRRTSLGLPNKWEYIEKWLFNKRDVKSVKKSRKKKIEKKYPNIQSLESYSITPNQNFWSNFPSYKPLKKVHKRIDIKKFENLISENWEGLTTQAKKTATKALHTVKFGANPKMFKELPNLQCKNRKSAIKHGELITDTIANWINQKFVAGPFDHPPDKKFRANPIIAVEQKSKIRPVLNLSAPEKKSYNDGIKPHTLRKLKMSSAKLFGYAIKKAGKGAKMYKYDICDAYKLIPTAPHTWRNFGFKWLGKFFFDMTCVFASKAAPENFDNVAETIVNIAKIASKAKNYMIHRTLDDVPIVTNKRSQLGENFATEYKKICKEINIPLAENCLNFQKAFENSTHGTVLGIKFDTKNTLGAFLKKKQLKL